MEFVTTLDGSTVDADFDFEGSYAREVRAATLPWLILRGRGLHQSRRFGAVLGWGLAWGLVCGAPLLRGLACLLLWLVPCSTTSHHLARHAVELLSVVACADVYAARGVPPGPGGAPGAPPSDARRP